MEDEGEGDVEAVVGADGEGELLDARFDPYGGMAVASKEARVETALGEDRHESLGRPPGNRPVEVEGTTTAANVVSACAEAVGLCALRPQVGGRCHPYGLASRLDRRRRWSVDHHRGARTTDEEEQEEGDVQAAHNGSR